MPVPRPAPPQRAPSARELKQWCCGPPVLHACETDMCEIAVALGVLKPGLDMVPGRPITSVGGFDCSGQKRTHWNDAIVWARSTHVVFDLVAQLYLPEVIASISRPNIRQLARGMDVRTSPWAMRTWQCRPRHRLDKSAPSLSAAFVSVVCRGHEQSGVVRYCRGVVVRYPPECGSAKLTHFAHAVQSCGSL